MRSPCTAGVPAHVKLVSLVADLTAPQMQDNAGVQVLCTDGGHVGMTPHDLRLGQTHGSSSEDRVESRHSGACFSLITMLITWLSTVQEICGRWTILELFPKSFPQLRDAVLLVFVTGMPCS